MGLVGGPDRDRTDEFFHAITITACNLFDSRGIGGHQKHPKALLNNPQHPSPAPLIILQNFWGTIIVDTVGIGLAAVGILNPLLATFIHVSSELIFILNSTRLLPSHAKVKAKKRREE
jgi:hypothetical protein